MQGPKFTYRVLIFIVHVFTRAKLPIPYIPWIESSSSSLGECGVCQPDSRFVQGGKWAQGAWAAWLSWLHWRAPAQVNARKDNVIGKRIGPPLMQWTKTQALLHIQRQEIRVSPWHESSEIERKRVWESCEVFLRGSPHSY